MDNNSLAHIKWECKYHLTKAGRGACGKAGELRLYTVFGWIW